MFEALRYSEASVLSRRLPQECLITRLADICSLSSSRRRRACIMSMHGALYMNSCGRLHERLDGDPAGGEHKTEVADVVVDTEGEK